MATILIGQKIPAEAYSELSDEHQVFIPKTESFTKSEMEQLIQNADVLLSFFNTHIDAELISKAPKLKMIANFGVGYNNIDIEAAKRHGIVVSNTPDPVTQPTAEHTFALLLSLARRIAELDRKLRSNEIADWKVMSNLGTTLNHKTIGIIGMGKIGQTVARMSRVFGMQVIYYSRTELKNYHPLFDDCKALTLNELLKTADVVSLHVPLTTATQHLINSANLKLMKPSALLINTARGPIVNETDLVEALQNKLIAGAAIDVFEHEPQINKALLYMDNVVLAPHTGTATIETRIEMGKCAVNNINAFLENRTLPNRVL